MSLFQTQKPKSAGKIMIPANKELSEIVVSTLEHIAMMVGATLGPGGRQVLLERAEMNMKPIITKDGVTVVKNLGYDNPVRQLILESVRDAALRTASEAGDGPQPLWAKILTPNGFITMGEAKEGMEICGSDGTTQKIVGVYKKGQKEIYKVEFSGGRVVECCPDHLWTVHTSTDVVKTMTTKEMLKDFVYTYTNGDVRYRYYTPQAVIEYKQSQEELPLDPYLLGTLLGDGSLSDSGSIELSLGKNKEHIIEKLKLPKGLYLKTTYSEEKNSFRVKIQGTTDEGKTIRDFVEEVGIRNMNSYTKRIPKDYLFGTKAVREALLQGLVDTDGYFNTRGNFEFSTVSDGLAEDFINLSRSLGKQLNIRIRNRENDPQAFSKNPIHVITELNGYSRGDKIVNIVPTGQLTEMQCIKVSNPNSLYVTDGFIVTHNTTTASILANAITKMTTEVVEKNRKLKISPQRIVREMQALVPEIIKVVKEMSYQVTDENFEDLLKKVARLSANGDEPLAQAMVDAFNLVGDEGNLIIVDMDGESKYSVEKIKGYTVDVGYEDVLKNYAQGFFNDKTGTMVVADDPVFLLFDGFINDTYQILDGLNALHNSIDKERVFVIVAHGFSDAFLGDMYANWTDGRTKVKVLPIRTPQSAIKNSGTHFLYDLQSYVNTPVFNPVNKPLNKIEPTEVLKASRARKFEYNKFRSSIIADEDQVLIEARVEQLKDLLGRADSEYEKYDLISRISKLTCGIARLTISAPSQGDIREKKDRAEDAWMAIRGAIKHGALPGGGYVLVRLSAMLINAAEKVQQVEKKLALDILSTALLLPVKTLYENYGYSQEDAESMISQLLLRDGETFDIMQSKWVAADQLLDSTPAVTEAIQNSVSIASLLGTLGGIVSFKRDGETDKEEEKFVRGFTQSIGERHD